MWRDGETPDLPSEWCFSGSESEYGKPFKSRLQRKKCPKSTFILTVNRPYLSIIQGKENRLSHRPISSAKGTGGLNFLIADALLILCHSLFEVVIEQVADRRQLVLALGGVDVVRDRHQADVVLREKLLGQPPHLNVVTAQPGQILHKHGGGLASGKLLHHVVEAGAVHRNARNAIVQEVDQVGVTFFLRHLGQQFLLERDLSRVFYHSATN